MIRELNDKLKTALLKNLAEYMPSCKESLVRNIHMHTFKEVELWYPTAEDLMSLETVVGYIIDIFANSYKGGDSLGDVATGLVDAAKKERAYSATVPDRELWDAVIVDFLNFWASKRCMDLGLYTKDLLTEPVPRNPHMQLIELYTKELEYVATVEIPKFLVVGIEVLPRVILWGSRFFMIGRGYGGSMLYNGIYYADRPPFYVECFTYASMTESPGLPRWEPPKPLPVDRDAVTVVGKAVAPGEPDTTPDARGQHAGYVVLTPAERAKGFVRPVRTTYTHVGAPGPRFELRDLAPEEVERYAAYHYIKFEAYPEGFKGSATGRFWTQKDLDAINKGCGQTTTMGTAIAETYARDPGFYGSTLCVTCEKHLPVGEQGEFVWEGTNERVGT